MTAPSVTASANPTAGIVARGLHVAYERDIEILRGVDLAAEPRRITVVIGPNGAGKSTFLKAVAGLAPVTAGSVSFGGTDITGWVPRELLRHGLAFVPQEGTLFGGMTVRENLQMGGWLRRREKAWLAQRIGEVVDRFGLERRFLDRRAGDLSGGQQKLVEIMRSLVLVPTALLLDEPTAGLSPKMADQIYQRVQALPRDLGVTILMVDQNVRASLAIADQVYVLAMGRNNAQGPASEIAARLGEITTSWMKEGASGAARF